MMPGGCRGWAVGSEGPRPAVRGPPAAGSAMVQTDQGVAGSGFKPPSSPAGRGGRHLGGGEGE